MKGAAVRAVVFFGVLYCAVGILFGLLAGRAPSHQGLVAWRSAAWAVSAVAFAAPARRVLHYLIAGTLWGGLAYLLGYRAFGRPIWGGVLAGLRVGVVSELEVEGAGGDPEVHAAVLAARKAMAAHGATMVPLSLPGARAGSNLFLVIMTELHDQPVARFHHAEHLVQPPSRDVSDLLERGGQFRLRVIRQPALHFTKHAIARRVFCRRPNDRS